MNLRFRSANTRSQEAEFGEIAKTMRAVSAHAGNLLPVLVPIWSTTDHVSQVSAMLLYNHQHLPVALSKVGSVFDRNFAKPNMSVWVCFLNEFREKSVYGKLGSIPCERAGSGRTTSRPPWMAHLRFEFEFEFEIKI